MGMTLWLNVRDGDTYNCDDDDHSAVLEHQDALGELASRLGIPPLSTFFDDTDVRYNMDETGEFEESEDGWPVNAARWFPASDVLASISALLDHLEANAEVLQETEGWTQADVVTELADWQEKLGHAAAASRTVHLGFVM